MIKNQETERIPENQSGLLIGLFSTDVNLEGRFTVSGVESSTGGLRAPFLSASCIVSSSKMLKPLSCNSATIFCKGRAQTFRQKTRFRKAKPVEIPPQDGSKKSLCPTLLSSDCPAACPLACIRTITFLTRPDLSIFLAPRRAWYSNPCATSTSGDW